MDGKNGRDATPIDLDKLTADVIARLPPMRFEIQEAGQTVATQVAPIGSTVKLNLIPIK